MATDETRPVDSSARITEQLRVLRERRWLILACVVITTVAAAAATLTATKEYSATARLLVEPHDELRSSVLGSGFSAQDADRQAATDLELFSLEPIAASVIRDLNLSMSPSALLSKVEADTKGTSNLIAVSATTDDPHTSSRVANAFGREYIAFRLTSNRRRLDTALSQVRAQITRLEPLGRTPELTQLKDQEDQIQLLRTLETGGASLVEPARPPGEASSPKPKRDIPLALVFGLLLGVALAFFRDKLDQRIKDEDHVRALLPDVPIVGMIPGRHGRSTRALETEGFRTLNTNLGFLNVGRPLQTLLITSSMAGEGKSTTSMNLALAMAERGRAVILFESDMRRPGLSTSFSLRGEPGVSNLLAGMGSVEEYLVPLQVDSSTNGRGPAAVLSGLVQFLPAGPSPPNPQALLDDGRIDDVLKKTTELADTVVIDGTPVGPFSDMLPVARRVDGVIVVVRLNYTRRGELGRLLDQLDQASIRPLGIVLFGVKAEQTDYHYARH
jgi:tyrosine-protein kinase